MTYKREDFSDSQCFWRKVPFVALSILRTQKGNSLSNNICLNIPSLFSRISLETVITFERRWKSRPGQTVSQFSRDLLFTEGSVLGANGLSFVSDPWAGGLVSRNQGKGWSRSSALRKVGLFLRTSSVPIFIWRKVSKIVTFLPLVYP